MTPTTRITLASLNTLKQIMGR